MRRVHVLVHGNVQGVFFRRNTKKLADSLGVRGFVMNVNGDVEAVFEGSDFAVADMLEFCIKGPLGAVVKKVDVKEEKYKNEFADFEVR
jgi:acylphosphatase